MKNLALALLAFALVAVGCKKNDPVNTDPPVANELSGDITGEQTLDASVEYSLVGELVIQDGGKLTIPAGTKIIAKDGLSNVAYIAVAQGGQIIVNGTADNPVVMTAEKKEAGSWGGLVLCGKAPINTGESSSEVGNLPYGGNSPSDNSGKLEYLRVEYTGYVYSGEKQFNGVSFFGVGNGTTVDYLVSYNGNDDGFEFFGGTVNPSHLVSVGSQDDGIDFADGWSGTGEYWYSLNSRKSGIEGSNNGADGSATPLTDAKIKYVSVYGMGEKPWYLKEGGGKQMIEDVVIGGLADGKGQPYFYIDSEAKDANVRTRINAGDIKVKKARFDYMGQGNNLKGDSIIIAGGHIEEDASAMGAGNGIEKPDWVSDALNTTSDGNKVIPDEVGSYVVLQGDVTSDVTLKAGTKYKLQGAYVVRDGASLTIPAGTLIEALSETVSYIAVAQGGKIFVNGTTEAPVIMTSDKKEVGSWGGLVLCGKAPINTGESTSEVGNLPYGGSIADDNSGVLSNLRVEYTGYIYTGEKQFNGISFFGVGSGTTVEHLVSYNSNDDGFEFFGGTVNPKYLLSVGSQDDGIDFADGWSGTGEYWYSKDSRKSGIEGSNNGADGAATPMTNATIKNATVVNMGEKPWYLKEGAGKQTIDNVIIGGLAASKQQPIFYTDDASNDSNVGDRIAAGDITITNVKFLTLSEGQTKAVDGLTFTEKDDATGAGNGLGKPDWLSDALNTLAGGEKILK